MVSTKIQIGAGLRFENTKLTLDKKKGQMFHQSHMKVSIEKDGVNRIFYCIFICLNMYDARVLIHVLVAWFRNVPFVGRPLGKILLAIFKLPYCSCSATCRYCV